MAQFIPSDESKEIQEVKPKNGRNFTLAELQEYVGGNIEVIDLPEGRCMVINEEGKFADPVQRNERATKMVAFKTAGQIRAEVAAAEARGEFAQFISPFDLPEDDNAPSDFIAGDALICRDKEAD